jgi:large subunit ribosomal protein L33
VRVGITLECTQCKNRNYRSTKNKKSDPDRIELKKFCKFCRTHTVHKETR